MIFCIARLNQYFFNIHACAPIMIWMQVAGQYFSGQHHIIVLGHAVVFVASLVKAKVATMFLSQWWHADNKHERCFLSDPSLLISLKGVICSRVWIVVTHIMEGIFRLSHYWIMSATHYLLNYVKWLDQVNSANLLMMFWCLDNIWRNTFCFCEGESCWNRRNHLEKEEQNFF